MPICNLVGNRMFVAPELGVEIEYHRNARKHIDGDIWEVRVRSGGEQIRFLYAVENRVAHLLVPIHKKQQKLDRNDIMTAQARFNEIRQRKESG